MITIVKVTARQLKNGGYEYTAHYSDGTSKITRKCATRRYAFMFQYWKTTDAKENAKENTAITFGKKPDRYAVQNQIYDQHIITEQTGGA